MSDLEEYLKTGGRGLVIPAYEEYKALRLKLREMEKETVLLNNELASRTKQVANLLKDCPECGNQKPHRLWNGDECTIVCHECGHNVLDKTGVCPEHGPYSDEQCMSCYDKAVNVAENARWE
jgi:hypothetical protein